MRLARAALLPALVLLALTVPTPAQEECQDCHDADPNAFMETVHGFMECTGCHTGATEIPHEIDALAVNCGECHDEVAEQYLSSIHGEMHEAGVAEAPVCISCHGDLHNLLPGTDSSSPVYPANLATTCGTCHSDPALVEKFGIPVAQPVQAYQASVHARGVTNGDHAATCSDCHESHALYPAADPRSTVFHQSVSKTCSQCHQEIAEAYDKSVHGLAARHGAREAPVCTDCHGEHRILSPTEKGSPVYASNVPKMTCGRCHSNLRLAEKYGLASNKVPAYEDSYHGLAARAGSITMAHCASCHGVHDIQPSSNPASHVHKENLAATCGQCHPGAGDSFAIGAVHVLPTEPDNAAVYLIRQAYLWLIFLTIGGMIVHNLLDLVKKTRSPQPPPPATLVDSEIRMLGGFRIAHLLLMTSFAVLVYTGFALTYPESWWARPLLHWEDILGLRGWLHRGAALVMLGALLFHMIHIMVNRRARLCIFEMRPTWHDWVEFRERMLWYVGRRKDPPPAPRLGYPEKMEYLALMWGILVMAASGFILWYENAAMRLLPKWVTDVATVIHFYEAILASLAILVWHFYFVLFDPVVYPMDTAWLTGRAHRGRVAERQAGQAAATGIAEGGKSGSSRPATAEADQPRKAS